jgi:uncharacterized RDD family membrane protein YckC
LTPKGLEILIAMYPLKRMIAYVIDMALVYSPLMALMAYVEVPFLGKLPPHFHLFGSLGAMGFALAGPILVNGVLTGLTGRSPGKFIMFLNVKDYGGDPPGIAQGILREIIKAVSLGFFFGMIYALRGLVTTGQTFYDAWLDLEVEDLRPSGLTETQKNWRKYHRELARRNRR